MITKFNSYLIQEKSTLSSLDIPEKVLTYLHSELHKTIKHDVKINTLEFDTLKRENKKRVLDILLNENVIIIKYEYTVICLANLGTFYQNEIESIVFRSNDLVNPIRYNTLKNQDVILNYFVTLFNDIDRITKDNNFENDVNVYYFATEIENKVIEKQREFIVKVFEDFEFKYEKLFINYINHLIIKTKNYLRDYVNTDDTENTRFYNMILSDMNILNDIKSSILSQSYSVDYSKKIDYNQSVEENSINMKNHYFNKIETNINILKQNAAISKIRNNEKEYSKLKKYLFDDRLKKKFDYLENAEKFDLV